MLKGDRSFQRRWEIVLADNKTSIKKPPFYIRWFFPILVLLGLAGGAAALWVPSNTGWLRQSGLSGEAEQKSISDLRLHFLYITGGIIAVLTLLQTNWKNQVDRLKVDADIKKNEQDAEKNERDHIRQVHAERRSRYTKAVEQLANEKAAVRLGGIYTLVGLVDEWLADETLDPEEQQKEGQVIINNLCSYIRSPFLIAEKVEAYEAHKELKELEEFETLFSKEVGSPRLQVLREFLKDSNEYKNSEDITADYAELREEQDIRRVIFAEMSKRSSTVAKGTQTKYSITPGPWSNFSFDFSRALIFYPLSHLTIEEANFTSARFYGESSFLKTIFTRSANFSEAAFTRSANFTETTFFQNADFCDVAFTQGADFWNVAFTQGADFFRATFTGAAGFGGATFAGVADFWDVVFTYDADFSYAAFTEDAYFRRASFTQNANFSEATFTKNANFCGTYFAHNANFDAAIFRTHSPKFVERNEDSGLIDRARFAILKYQNTHNFTVSRHSQPVRLGEIELNDVKYSIPVGTTLFDPNSWDEEKYRYTYVSEPAKPVENSDAEEEKPAE